MRRRKAADCGEEDSSEAWTSPGYASKATETLLEQAKLFADQLVNGNSPYPILDQDEYMKAAEE